MSNKPNLRRSTTLLAMLALAMSGCQKNGADTASASGRLAGRSDCKSQGAAEAARADNLDCLEYRYENGLLRLRHVNAAFNCCPGEIGADFGFAGQAITIRERETAASCSCNCLYDLELEIAGLPPGEYAIQVIEPYAVAGDAPLAFQAQLAEGASGCFCVERSHYPWNLESDQ